MSEITLRDLIETITGRGQRATSLKECGNCKSENGWSWPMSPDIKVELHSSPAI